MSLTQGSTSIKSHAPKKMPRMSLSSSLKGARKPTLGVSALRGASTGIELYSSISSISVSPVLESSSTANMQSSSSLPSGDPQTTPPSSLAGQKTTRRANLTRVLSSCFPRSCLGSSGILASVLFFLLLVMASSSALRVSSYHTSGCKLQSPGLSQHLTRQLSSTPTQSTFPAHLLTSYNAPYSREPMFELHRLTQLILSFPVKKTATGESHTRTSIESMLMQIINPSDPSSALKYYSFFQVLVCTEDDPYIMSLSLEWLFQRFHGSGFNESNFSDSPPYTFESYQIHYREISSSIKPSVLPCTYNAVRSSPMNVKALASCLSLNIIFPDDAHPVFSFHSGANASCGREAYALLCLVPPYTANEYQNALGCTPCPAVRPMVPPVDYIVSEDPMPGLLTEEMIGGSYISYNPRSVCGEYLTDFRGIHNGVRGNCSVDHPLYGSPIFVPEQYYNNTSGEFVEGVYVQTYRMPGGKVFYATCFENNPTPIPFECLSHTPSSPPISIDQLEEMSLRVEQPTVIATLGTTPPIPTTVPTTEVTLESISSDTASPSVGTSPTTPRRTTSYPPPVIPLRDTSLGFVKLESVRSSTQWYRASSCTTKFPSLSALTGLPVGSSTSPQSFPTTLPLFVSSYPTSSITTESEKLCAMVTSTPINLGHDSGQVLENHTTLLPYIVTSFTTKNETFSAHYISALVQAILCSTPADNDLPYVIQHILDTFYSKEQSEDFSFSERDLAFSVNGSSSHIPHLSVTRPSNQSIMIPTVLCSVAYIHTLRFTSTNVPRGFLSTCYRSHVYSLLRAEQYMVILSYLKDFDPLCPPGYILPECLSGGDVVDTAIHPLCSYRDSCPVDPSGHTPPPMLSPPSVPPISMSPQDHLSSSAIAHLDFLSPYICADFHEDHAFCSPLTPPECLTTHSVSGGPIFCSPVSHEGMCSSDHFACKFRSLNPPHYETNHYVLCVTSRVPHIYPACLNSSDPKDDITYMDYISASEPAGAASYQTSSATINTSLFTTAATILTTLVHPSSSQLTPDPTISAPVIQPQNPTDLPFNISCCYGSFPPDFYQECSCDNASCVSVTCRSRCIQGCLLSSRRDFELSTCDPLSCVVDVHPVVSCVKSGDVTKSCLAPVVGPSIPATTPPPRLGDHIKPQQSQSQDIVFPVLRTESGRLVMMDEENLVIWRQEKPILLMKSYDIQAYSIDIDLTIRNPTDNLTSMCAKTGTLEAIQPFFTMYETLLKSTLDKVLPFAPFKTDPKGRIISSRGFLCSVLSFFDSGICGGGDAKEMSEAVQKNSDAINHNSEAISVLQKESDTLSKQMSSVIASIGQQKKLMDAQFAAVQHQLELEQSRIELVNVEVLCLRQGLLQVTAAQTQLTQVLKAIDDLNRVIVTSNVGYLSLDSPVKKMIITDPNEISDTNKDTKRCLFTSAAWAQRSESVISGVIILKCPAVSRVLQTFIPQSVKASIDCDSVRATNSDLLDFTLMVEQPKKIDCQGVVTLQSGDKVDLSASGIQDVIDKQFDGCLTAPAFLAYSSDLHTCDKTEQALFCYDHQINPVPTDLSPDTHMWPFGSLNHTTAMDGGLVAPYPFTRISSDIYMLNTPSRVEIPGVINQKLPSGSIIIPGCSQGSWFISPSCSVYSGSWLASIEIPRSLTCHIQHKDTFLESHITFSDLVRKSGGILEQQLTNITAEDAKKFAQFADALHKLQVEGDSVQQILAIAGNNASSLLADYRKQVDNLTREALSETAEARRLAQKAAESSGLNVPAWVFWLGFALAIFGSAGVVVMFVLSRIQPAMADNGSCSCTPFDCGFLDVSTDTMTIINWVAIGVISSAFLIQLFFVIRRLFHVNKLSKSTRMSLPFTITITLTTAATSLVLLCSQYDVKDLMKVVSYPYLWPFVFFMTGHLLPAVAITVIGFMSSIPCTGAAAIPDTPVAVLEEENRECYEEYHTNHIVAIVFALFATLLFLVTLILLMLSYCRNSIPQAWRVRKSDRFFSIFRRGIPCAIELTNVYYASVHQADEVPDAEVQFIYVGHINGSRRPNKVLITPGARVMFSGGQAYYSANLEDVYPCKHFNYSKAVHCGKLHYAVNGGFASFKCSVEILPSGYTKKELTNYIDQSVKDDSKTRVADMVIKSPDPDASASSITLAGATTETSTPDEVPISSFFLKNGYAKKKPNRRQSEKIFAMMSQHAISVPMVNSAASLVEFMARDTPESRSDQSTFFRELLFKGIAYKKV